MRLETLNRPAASSPIDKLLSSPGGGVPFPWAESPGDSGRGRNGFKGPEVRGGGRQRQGCKEQAEASGASLQRSHQSKVKARERPM